MFSGYPDQNSYGGDDSVSPHPAVINYSFATGSCSTGPPTTYTDEEEVVKLASSNPKKPAGRKKFQETRHPVYRGVRQRSSGKWVCETREPNKKTRIWLGTFPTLEMAARAHDVAAIALRGRSACLNFADSAWRLPIPASNHPKDIQKAAAEAAELFRPKENNGCDAVNVEEAVAADERPFVDEEYDVFGMPGLLANMAEGMLLPPPQQLGDDLEDGGDVPLWTEMMQSPRQLTNPPNNNNYSAREGYVSSSAAIVPLISTLIALYQMKHQTAKLSPFEAHNMVIVAFVISVFIYTMALAGEIRLQTQAQYLAYCYILGKISFFSGFLASILLVIDLLPVIGWVLLTLWTIFFLRAVSSSCTELFYPTLLKLCLILYSKFRQLPPQRLPV